jgi:3-oxoacyl-[acyl-carrier protein] reductase
MKDREFKLVGETAIVTGAVGDLGYAMADALMTHGANVAIFDVKEDAGQARAATLNEEHNEIDGTRAIFVKVDLRDPADTKRAVDEVIADFGKVEILVNNAGIDHEHVDTWEIPEETLNAVLDIDLKGCYHTIQAVVPYWIENKIEGRICQTASVNALRSMAVGGLGAYSPAKAGVANLTAVVATEAGRYGIRCNCICPGLCITSMTERFAKGPAGKAFYDRTPLYEFSDRARVGAPEDQAKAVVFLCSNYAEWITGQVLAVDGGNQTRGLHHYTDEDYKAEHGEYPHIEW